MKTRYELIKDEIMYIISLSPEAMHSIGGMHERLKDKVLRTEIERSVACLLARQHIKKLGAYVFGLGTKEGIKPYPLDDYNPGALQAADKPQTSNKQKIADAEKKRREQSAGKKTMQDWHNGSKPAVKPPAPPEQTRKEPVVESTEKQSCPEPKTGQLKEKDIVYALEQLQHRLVDPPCPQVRDLHIKVSVLEKLARIVDPTIGSVLDQIKDDLKGEAA